MQYDGGTLAIQLVTSTVTGVNELARMTLVIKSVCIEDRLEHDQFSPAKLLSIYRNEQIFDAVSWSY